MKQQHGSNFAARLVLAFTVMVGIVYLRWPGACTDMVGTVYLHCPGKQKFVEETAGRATAHSRLLAATSGFERGELPSAVKVSNSRHFDGFYQNMGSSKGKDGVRTAFAVHGDKILYYDPESDQWVLKSHGKSARCDPLDHAVLPEEGMWQLDSGSKVQIDIAGYDVRAGKTFTTNLEKLNELLHDIKKPSGISFDVGVDVEGKQRHNDVDEGDVTQKPASGNPSTTSATSNPETSRTGSSGGNPSTNSTIGGEMSDPETNQTSRGGGDAQMSNSNHSAGSNRDPHLVDGYSPDEIASSINSSTSAVEDIKYEFPLGYKILLLGLALSSLICACICCTVGGFPCAGTGEGGLERRKLVPDGGPSDTEDAENETRLR